MTADRDSSCACVLQCFFCFFLVVCLCDSYLLCGRGLCSEAPGPSQHLMAISTVQILLICCHSLPNCLSTQCNRPKTFSSLTLVFFCVTAFVMCFFFPVLPDSGASISSQPAATCRFNSDHLCSQFRQTTILQPFSPFYQFSFCHHLQATFSLQFSHIFGINKDISTEAMYAFRSL